MGSKVFVNLVKLIEQDPDVKMSNGEFRLECPVCRDLGYSSYKRKLFVKNDMTAGYCFRCGTTFINKFDINYNKNFNFRTIKPKPKDFKEEAINVDEYLNASDYNKDGLDYLKSRRQWLYDNYKKVGFRFRNDRLYIPFYKDGTVDSGVIFYQSRFYNPEKSGKRYLIPKSTNKPIYFSPNGNNSSDTLILCEGPFGAIAISNSYPNFRCGAVMGSHISEYQLWLLEKLKVKNFILYFDNMEINNKAKSILANKFPDANFMLLESPKGDPEDDLIFSQVPSIDESKYKRVLDSCVMNFISKASQELNCKPYEKSKSWKKKIHNTNFE